MQEYQCVDIAWDMIKLAENLFEGPPDDEFVSQLRAKTKFRTALPPKSKGRFDLSVMAHTLCDVKGGARSRLALLRELWERTDQVLVLIEHGNKEGFGK